MLATQIEQNALASNAQTEAVGWMGGGVTLFKRGNNTGDSVKVQASCNADDPSPDWTDVPDTSSSTNEPITFTIGACALRVVRTSGGAGTCYVSLRHAG